MDTAQWPQGILVKPPSMEDMIPHTTTPPTTCCNNIISNNNNNNNNSNSNNSTSKTPSTSLERKVRPQKDQAVNCPRCNSTNTKFCYYNNYSLTQPRYFCKTCRRYWTEGGSLRNIPVGGGSRKNKRSSSSSSSSPSAKRHHSSHDLLSPTLQQQQQQQLHHHHQSLNPKIFHHHHQGQDLNLGYPQNQHPQQHEFRSLSEFMQLPTIDNVLKPHIPNSGVPTTTDSNGNGNGNGSDNGHHISALELLNGLTSTRGLTPFMPMPVPDPNGVYTSGFGMHDYKPGLNFSLVDGLGNGYEVHQQHHHQQQQTNDSNSNSNNNNNNSTTTNNNDGRLLFPFEDLKQVSSTTSADHTTTTTTNNSGDNHDQNGGGGGEQGDSTPPGYWSGMLSNGGSW